jgi:hypothetical protein
MFKPKPDPQKLVDDLAAQTAIKLDQLRNSVEERLVKVEFKAEMLKGKLELIDSSLGAIEEKLDELLKAQDVASRSIPGEQPKPEELNAMPGHVPWSARKRAREQAARSSVFIDKVKKSAAITEPKTEEASE